jgi:cytochrome c oxidase subunit 4
MRENMDYDKTAHTISASRTYIVTWIALVILAAASIIITSLDTGAGGIVIALLIASVKAVLILYFFMHLRYEKRFFRLAFLLPIVAFAFFIGFTFLDILYR